MEIDKAKDQLIDSKQEHEWAVHELNAFERNVRKHAYPLLIVQSNSQKMNLEFEHAVAQEEENWKKWQQLINNVTTTSLDLFESELIWEIAITEYRNGNLE